MATTDSLSVEMPTLTVHVVVPKMLRVRMWAVTRLLRLVSLVGGPSIALEIVVGD